MALNASIKITLVDQVSASVKRMAESFNGVSSSLSAIRARAQPALDMSASIKHSADGLLDLGAKIKGVTNAAFGAFVPFEQQMTRVKALTKASSVELAQMTELAKQVGAEGRFSATEAAKGMELLKTQGFSVNEVMAAMKPITDAAIISNTGLAETIDATTGIMDSFGLGADQVGRVTDLLTNTFTVAGTPIGSLAAALQGTGAAAVEAGIPIERVTVLAGLLATKNIEGGQAAATLEKTLKTLIHPAEDAGRFFKYLGVTTTETVGGIKKMRDPLAILTDLQDKMTKKGISQNDQLRNMTVLFERAAPDVLALIRASKEPGMQALADAVQNAGGATANLAKDLKSGATENIRKMHGALEDLAITLGGEVAPHVTNTAKTITDLVNTFGAWSKEHPGFTKGLVGAAIAAGSGALALGTLGQVASGIVATKAVFQMASGFAGLGSTVLKSLVPALASGAAGAWAMVAPFLPLGAAIAGVSAAIFQLQKHWDALDFGEAFKGIKDAIGDGSFLKTLNLNPLQGIGLGDVTSVLPSMGGAASAAALVSLPNPFQEREAQATSAPAIGARAAPNGLIRIKIDSDQKARVVEQRSSGIELDASAGLVMGGG